MTEDELVATLGMAQRLGMIGARPIGDAIDHARDFVRAVAPIPAGTRVIDLGSGGGLPGLVMALDAPDAAITLVDRRSKRTDFLARAVARLGARHVDVRCADVADVVRLVAGGELAPFDLATARGFGPPEVTLRLAAGLTGPGGRIVVSEPPSGDRWDPDLLAELGLVGHRRGAVRVFSR